MVPDSPSFCTESPRPRVTTYTALLFYGLCGADAFSSTNQAMAKGSHLIPG